MKRALIFVPLLAVGAFGLSACSTVQYGEATAVETVNTDFGSTDLQMIAEKMVDDMLASGAVAQIGAGGKRPVLFVDKVKNKTTEHIDTESITDTISTKLLNSGKFRFVDMTAVDAVMRQLDFQKSSGLVDEAKSVQAGKQLGAQYMLYGNISSIVKTAGSTKDVYFKFTLKLTDIESGLVEFQSEKEIRKTRKKNVFGS